MTLLACGLLPIVLLLRDVQTYNTVGRPIRRRGRVLRRHEPADPCSARQVWASARNAEADSVTAFLEVGERLRRVGAPDRLVQRCERAAAEEVRHARICARLSRLAEPSTELDEPAAPSEPDPVEPARFGGRQFGGRRYELVRLAVESYVDGVIGENAGADDLDHAADDARGSAAVALRVMAREERGHAELGADIVGWCLSEAPIAVGAALRRSNLRP